MSVNHHFKIVVLSALLYLPVVQADIIASNPIVPQGTTALPTTKDQYTLSELTPSIYTNLNTDQQKTIADQWHLSIDDYSHYLSLMSNTPNAFYYKDKNLDPSWILGFNAKDEQERQKYVIIAIQNERDRIEKELAFQRDFTQLQQQLYPSQKPVNWVPDTTSQTNAQALITPSSKK